ncbi:ankyrin repeat domain-containing protein 42-like [Engraulis encrasicolus]|uniref:ankyrin repeat domain-containing protein 42-like n=1 Tax=Engraulis encrasicolus TaxID=184585 RepID=UPI002FD2C0C4
MSPAKQTGKRKKRQERSLVIEAVKRGDIDGLRLVAKTRADIDVVDSDQHFTPLLWACQAGHLQCLVWLLEHGADVSFQTERGWTAAHVAAITGQDQCMKALIEHGVDLTIMDGRGCTASHLAAAHGHAGTLHTILRKGVDVQLADKSGWMPLHHAAFHGRLNCIQTLLRWGANAYKVDGNGNTPAHLAAAEGHLACVKYLLTKCTSEARVMDTRNNHGETVRDLALQFNKLAVVDFIDKAATENRNDWVELKALRHPAHVAAYRGDVDTLRRLMEQGQASVNERDEDGSIPMHKAAGQGHLRSLECLLEMGGDHMLRNNAGETPLDVAKRFAQLAAVKLLSTDVPDTATEDPRAMESTGAQGSLFSSPKQHDLQEKLEAERVSREKLESQMDVYRTEIRQLRQALQRAQSACLLQQPT